MKKASNNMRMSDHQVIAFLEDVLVEEGYMLPRETKHITNEDLALFGKGKPESLDVLRESFDALMERLSGAAPGSKDVSDSLAMAARNGSRISDAVWKRMREDRENAEVGSERHD